MTNRLILVLMTLAVIAAPAREKRAAPAETSIRAEVRLVLLPVTVVDRTGASVNGLRAGNFSVADNNTPQPIVAFSEEDALCSTGIILDVSASMRSRLPAAIEAVRVFLKSMNEGDETLMTAVSSRPKPISGFTPDTGKLLHQLIGMKASGDTALIDAVYSTLSHLQSAHHNRRAIIVVSDGVDNRSRFTQRDLVDLALESDVQIHTVVPFDPSTKKAIEIAEERRGLLFLQELSARTGGLHFEVRDPAEISPAVTKIGEALRNQYMIGYQPPDPGPESGKWRKVRVRSNVPNTRVYTRSGYYAR